MEVETLAGKGLQKQIPIGVAEPADQVVGFHDDALADVVGGEVQSLLDVDVLQIRGIAGIIQDNFEIVSAGQTANRPVAIGLAIGEHGSRRAILQTDIIHG